MTDVVLLVIGLLLLAGAAVLAWRVYRAVQARVAATRVRIARVQAQAQLRAQRPGPKKDAALLRQRLQTELDSTRQLLDSSADGMVFRADARVLLSELVTTATDVERELAAIEGFLDEQQQRAAFDRLKEQAEQLIATSYGARQTVLETAVADRARRIEGLQADVARQARALEVYKHGDDDLKL
jgi:hypothetical protein